MLGLSANEVIEELNNDFCAFQVSEFLEKIGFLQEKQPCTTEDLQRLVFLQGNQEEVYTVLERKFIERVGKVYIFPEFYKKTNRGNMPCRFIAVDLSKWRDDIYNAVFFMKIIIKAFSGFSLFIIKSNDGIHLGARLFDKTEWKNCTLSRSDELPDMLAEADWKNDADYFFDFYNSVIEAITPVAYNHIGYDEKISRSRGVQAGYIDMLNEVGNIYGESILDELERYRGTFEEVEEQGFAEILEECEEDLKNVRSTKVNTIEMLFEAEELEKIAERAEAQRNADFESSTNSESNYTVLGELNDDPEVIIKKLKNLKGLR